MCFSLIRLRVIEHLAGRNHGIPIWNLAWTIGCFFAKRGRILRIKDGDSDGSSVSFNRDDIVKMAELQVSSVPVGLPLLLTDRELRDSLAFLRPES